MPVKYRLWFEYGGITLAVNPSTDDFLTYSYIKMDLSDEIRYQLYKYINILSGYWSFSNFVYDEDKGYLVCQCYTNCYGCIPSREIIEESIIDVMRRMDSYYDIFTDLSKGKVLPDEVLEKIATFEFRRIY